MASPRTDPLQSPVERLQAAVTSADGSDPVQWLDHFGAALTDFWRGLCAHESASEAPNGALATLDSQELDTTPKVDRQVQQLRLDHVEMFDSTRELMAKVATLSRRSQFGDRDPQLANDIAGLRQASHEMICRTHDHREVENKLFLESITTDPPGAGD